MLTMNEPDLRTFSRYLLDRIRLEVVVCSCSGIGVLCRRNCDLYLLRLY